MRVHKYLTYNTHLIGHQFLNVNLCPEGFTNTKRQNTKKVTSEKNSLHNFVFLGFE